MSLRSRATAGKIVVGAWLGTMTYTTVFMLIITWPAWLAHELAHYVTARWAQLHPTLRWTPFPACEYDAPAPIYVRLAPTFHGLLIFVAQIATRGVPELTPLSTLAILYWAVYTYPSASDRNPEVVS